MDENDEPRLKDYEHWQQLNQGTYSLYEYAYGVAFNQHLPADAIIALAGVIWPTFVEQDGLVLLAEQYDVEKLAGLRSQSLPADRVEFWMNLLSVDGFFQSLPGATPAHARSLARTLCQSWQAKLAMNFPQRNFEVEVVEDEDVGDVCVVFNQTATDS